MKYFVTSRLSENISETPEGFLLCLGVPIARTGEMTYGPGESPIDVGPDGRAIVSRDAKELFRPETIASFEGKAFTVTHPEDFVNPRNWKVLAKGVAQNVRRGRGEHEGDMIADILVTDADAIALVKGGVREISCGYECEYIQTGIGRGMQTNIIGNHVALVEQGRAGATYAINDQQGAKMSKLSEKIKGIFAKAGDEAAKVADEASKETTTETTVEDKAPAWAVKLEKTMSRVADGLSEMAASKDEDKEDDKSKDADADVDADKEKKAKDADEDMPAWAKAICKRLDALEGSTSDEDEDKEKSEDEEEEVAEDEEGESEDDDFEETPAASATDEASRIEILAPGSKFTGKNAKRKALMKAYESKDTAAVIKNLNGGKTIDLKKASQKTIDHLFVGASEVVSLYRTKDFTKWKQVRDSQTENFGSSEGMTAEKINEINAKHYAKEGVH